MVRRYEEPVEVREAGPTDAVAMASAVGATSPGLAADDEGSAVRPTAFVWRGRLYVVRDVIGHWRERRAWWRDALDPREGEPMGAVDLEQDVWRVAASPGRMLGTGVYDLARDGRAPVWRLVRVAD